VRWTFVVAPDHPLAGIAQALSDDQLRRFPAINVEDTSRNLNKRTAWKLALQQEILVPDMQTKIAAHSAGLGVGFIPAVAARPLIRKKQLVACRVVNERPPSPLSLVWHRDGTGKILKYLLELCLANDPLVQCFFVAIDRQTKTSALAEATPGV
jgi:LysR family transcriptional regulator, transcriptional activator of the allD operon